MRPSSGVKKTTKMGKLIDAYAKRKGIYVGTIRAPCRWPSRREE